MQFDFLVVVAKSYGPQTINLIIGLLVIIILITVGSLLLGKK